MCTLQIRYGSMAKLTQTNQLIFEAGLNQDIRVNKEPSDDGLKHICKQPGLSHVIDFRGIAADKKTGGSHTSRVLPECIKTFAQTTKIPLFFTRPYSLGADRYTPPM